MFFFLEGLGAVEQGEGVGQFAGVAGGDGFDHEFLGVAAGGGDRLIALGGHLAGLFDEVEPGGDVFALEGGGPAAGKAFEGAGGR